jgi:hypothetical protein
MDMRRLALYAVAIVLVGAAAPRVPWFTPSQALSALVRDDQSVAGCMQQDAKNLRAGITVSAIASNPKLALVQVMASCVCGAQNCPFWVYRVDGDSAKRLVDGFVIDVSMVPRSSGPPDIVAVAHDSALVTDGTRYAYRNGTYVAVDSWRSRGDTGARKPMSVAIKFVPGTSSTHLAGAVSVGWGDVYTFAASAGQRLTTSSLHPASDIDVELFPENRLPVHVLLNGKGIFLPATGTYQLTVDPATAGYADSVHYRFTLEIQ